MSHLRRFLVSLIIVVFLVSGFDRAQAQGGDANWPYPAFDPNNTNFDPQTTINNNNVAQLQLSWVYQVPVNPFHIAGAAPALGIETTPLVVSGIVYFATPYNRLIALNSVTGAVVWFYQVNMSAFSSKPWWANAYIVSSILYSNGTVYMMASDTSLYAFNALTGHVKFIIPDTGQGIMGNTGYYFGEKAPLIYRNLLLVRASTTDYGGRGYVAAYDLNTQKLAWRWYSVPAVGGNRTWDSITCPSASCSGNVQTYEGDWGTTNYIGGGAAWGLMVVDNSTGILYFSTGHPSGVYDASLRPGPNLYSDSVIALDAATGKMIWYYQINSHDVAEHEGGWSISLTQLSAGGSNRKVIVQAAKNNYVYVLDAATGKPVYSPIRVGPQSSNSPNDNAGLNSNLTLSQQAMVGGRVCPGPDGGVEMSPAIHDGTLFVVTQNACGLMTVGPATYKAQTINGYIYNGDPSAAQNSTLYAINLGNGQTVWKFEMPFRYQGSSAVVSGGVVYVIDRSGVLYALDEQSGKVLKSINLGGLGAAGISLAQTLRGQETLFVPAGGGDLPSPTPGVVLAFGLPTNPTTTGGGLSVEEITSIALGVVVIVMALYIIAKRGARRGTV